ncbi:unnamed protein product [Caenorhabditis auriculariae]|uniref:C-type lectin domain-containing protein n=1 Tax=Caenorhabditis auriculariae TaxID=2777116 RepID=A0A8S1HGX2_9PELO|nr:unnamed protein product [Caenorhabditis auriculariae]
MTFCATACPNGWNAFARSGYTWCLKVFAFNDVEYDIAEQKCMREKTLLSAFESEQEWEFIRNEAKRMGLFGEIYVGIRREIGCIKIQQVSRDLNAQCSIKTAFRLDPFTKNDYFYNKWNSGEPSGSDQRRAYVVNLVTAVSMIISNDNRHGYLKETFKRRWESDLKYDPRGFVCGTKAR